MLLRLGKDSKKLRSFLFILRHKHFLRQLGCCPLPTFRAGIRSEMQSRDIDETVDVMQAGDAYQLQGRMRGRQEEGDEEGILCHARVTERGGTEGSRMEGRSRLLDEHEELDSLPEFLRPGRVSPPRVQDGSHVPEDLVKRLEKRMKATVLPKYGSSESEQPPTIYNVPKELRGGHEEAYLPVAVEIGLIPRPGYYDLEDYKWWCVRKLFSRHRLLQEPERMPTLLRRCLNALKSLEPRIRASYPRDQEERGIRQGLLRVMLLDGCFILHRLLKYARIARREANSSSGTGTGSGKDDEDDDDDWTQVFGRCWVWGFVTCDLLLLENQIPFFVVQKLFEQLRTDPDETSDVLIAGALRLFRSLRPQKLHSSPISCRDVHHLLHLFHLSVDLPAAAAPDVYTRRHAVPPSELPHWIPCARELEEAGVKFRARKVTESASFLDVRFHGGVLEIPELQLYDYSEPLFRNLIAFEQTYPFVPCHVTAYAIFMDCLVTSPEDMRLLHLSGVLVNQMSGAGERDAAGFFGRLCVEAHLAADRNYLASVIGQVDRYRRSSWPRWRAALVRNYFSSPWVTMSLLAAVFLLALTMLQSFFAAYSYFKPPKQQ